MSLDEKLTVCIPTHNNLPTIRIALTGLSHQLLRPRILVLDNGSKDGTVEALGAQLKNKWFGNMQLELTKSNAVSGGRTKNIPLVRHLFCQTVITDFLMFLDSDVLIPPNILSPMLELVLARPKLGMLGLRYDPIASHVKLGATIVRTAIVKDHRWKIDPQVCECVRVARFFESGGFTVEHFPDQTARHLRYF